MGVGGRRARRRLSGRLLGVWRQPFLHLIKVLLDPVPEEESTNTLCYTESKYA